MKNSYNSLLFFFLLFNFFFTFNLFANSSNSDSTKLVQQAENPNNSDYPECESDFRFEVYKVSDNQIIVKVNQEAHAELYRYDVVFKGHDKMGDIIENSKSITFGKSISISGINTNLPFQVSIKRVCFFNEFEVYGQTFEYESDRNIRELINEFNCEEFNGGQLNQNGPQSDWVYLPGGLVQISENHHLKFVIKPCNDMGNPISVYYSNYADTIFIGAYMDSLSIEACDISVTLLWGLSENNIYTDSCGPITLFEMDPNPSLSCQDTTTLTPITSTTPLDSLNIDDIFFINVGFPVKVVTVSGSNGEFSGTGELFLPFTSKKLKVNFNGKINTGMWMWNGGVLQSNQDSFDYSGNASFGSLACYKSDDEWDENGNHILTGEPWDPRGFGQNGQYSKEPPYPGYQEGDPFDPNYDPCGFDAEGIHFETETQYNPDGCSRDSLDSDNKSCVPCSEPYSWLNPESPPSSDGIALANMYADSLIPIITAYLNTLKSENTSAKTSVQDSINTLKTSVLSLTSHAGLNNSFLFGENNEYISIGCSKLFTDKPQEYSINDYRRDSTIIEIEEKHITIYEIDERLEIYLRKDSIITNELLEPNLLISKEEILYLIRRLQSDSITHYSSNYSAFTSWVHLTLNDKLNSLFEGSYNPWPIDENFGSNKSIFSKKSQSTNSEQSGIEELDIESDLEEAENLQKSESKLNSQIASSPLPFNSISSKAPHKSDNYLNVSTRSYNEIELKALALEQKIRLKSNQVTSRSSGDAIDAPLSITNSVEGSVYDIILDDFKITHSNASLSAYCVINDANSGNKIVFGAQHIGFDVNGFTDSVVIINLFSDIEFKLLNTAQLKILGGPGTYVSFNCNGYIECGVDAQIEFCPNYFAPVDTTTMTINESDTARVRAEFSTVMPKWGQFITSVSIDPFVVVDAPNLVWRIDDAIIDFSDVATPNIIFPENYNHPFVYDQVASPLWKGFHLKKLQVDVLEKFGDENATNLSIGVEDMIIDDVGFTGRFSVEGNFISLETGNLGGWAFSVNEIEISIIANRLDGGGMSGLLHVPLFKQNESDTLVNVNDCVEYRAFYQKDRSLVFSVTPLANYKVPLWKADLTLSSETTISVKIEGGDVDIRAKLSGMLNIRGDINGSQDTIPNLVFKNVLLKNKFPYLAGGTFEVPTGSDTAKVQGFTFTLSQVLLQIPGEEENSDIKLELIAGISLSQNDLSLTAQGWMEFTGNVTIQNGRQVFQYTGFDLKGFYIETVLKKKFALKGGLIIYKNDSNWGTGFKGLISVKIESINTELAAVAFFGKKDGLKYFLVDMLFVSDNGVPLGPLTLNGIGGGLYYHVGRINNDLYALPSSYTPPTSLEGLANGTSLSGIQYQFNPNVFIGFKATVYLSTAGTNAFNGSATFEMVFNSQVGNSNNIGGLEGVYIQGSANFMQSKLLTMVPSFTSLENATTPPASAAMNAFLDIKLDFSNGVYDGELAVFLNTGLLNGIGPGGRLGYAKIHFSPQKWYIHIGTPTDKLGLSLSLPGVQNIAQVSCYFAIGTDVPDIPPLPDKFSRFNSQLGLLNNIRSSGKGFAFGASLEVNTGDLTFLMFYAKFALGLGFDVMVKDYGDAYCLNTNETLGINGWYATGQIWAYVEGEMGIKFAGKQYHLFKLGAQAALQAQLPNPFYARGTLGFSYSILGGLKKGKADFDFQIGEKCNIQGASENTDSELILATYPAHNSEGVEVESNASVSLAIPTNTDFDYSGSLIRLELSNLSIQHEEYDISGKTKIRDDQMQVEFIPDYMLPPNTELKFIYEFKEYNQGVYQRMVFDTIVFTTGDLPDVISETNIAATYPIDNMMNFYKHEYSKRKGYILMVKSQAYLFNSDGDSKPYFRLVRPDSTYVLLPHSFVSSTEIEFDMPDSLVDNGEFYKVQLVLQEGKIYNYPSSGALLTTFPAPSFVSPFAHQANEIDPNNKLKILYEVNFRTSLYNTFKSKIDAYILNKTIPSRYLNTDAVYYTVSGLEPFDRLECDAIGIENMVNIKGKVNTSQLRYCDSTCWPSVFYSHLPLEFHDGSKYIFFGSEECEHANCLELLNLPVQIFSPNNSESNFLSNNFQNSIVNMKYSGIQELKDIFSKLHLQIAGASELGGIDVLNNQESTFFYFLNNTYSKNLSLFQDNMKYCNMTFSYHLPGKNQPSSIFTHLID